MIRRTRLALALALAVFAALNVVGASAQNSAVPSERLAVRYTISLAHPAEHLVHIKVDVPPGAAERDLQLPVWNALYQVHDFAQYVNWVRAKNANGQPVSIRKLDKSRWHISGAESGAEAGYEIFADQPGPFGAQLNSHHAFFNLAEVLMYPVDERSSRMAVCFTDLPANWRIATPLRQSSSGCFEAENYDQLVDSPVEVGSFQEADLDEGGALYRVVVDADPADYDLQQITRMLRSIVSAATSWMDDRPFESYMFFYHFPRGPAGGGMEHAYSTAIDVSASRLAENPQSLADVTGHEFFHLWNVKRIRPQSLEPIDYTKENYTTALWFSEGVTSTAANCIRLRAGLLDESRYLNGLAAQIGELEQRPAHLTQSAEESSLDAWLEKYDDYRLPERSVSYYNKGYLLGVLLDLQVREASHGGASLREVFHWMNQNYARQGRFFPDSEGVRQAAEAVSHADLGWFFQKYVSGTEEIPWDDFFKTVGLRLVRRTMTLSDPGFTAVQNFNALPSVASVEAGSAAEQAGLAAGDAILEFNGRAADAGFGERLAELHPGDTLHLRVRNRRGEREVHWKVGSREEVEFELKDVDNTMPQQKARRAAWLKGESQGAARP